MQATEKYMNKVHEMARKVSPHENIIKIAELLSETIKTSMREATSYIGSGGFGEIEEGKPLVPKAFPPCIQNTLDGVKSGNRNDAIVLLLTSFLSYARLYPGIFRDEYANVRVSDIDPELAIVNNEILPLVHHAADNCSPPLFEDDPQEKLNVIAKLGFGVHEEADLSNEGETTWYTPMSCEKIKIHLSSLCHEDKICKKVGNPLSYYNRKKWIMQRENKNKVKQINNNEDIEGNTDNTVETDDKKYNEKNKTKEENDNKKIE
jgi:DNA primase large subunit